MSWFGSRSTSSSSGLDSSAAHLNKQKHKQVENLKEHIHGVVELKRDEQYSITITVNGLTLTLNIILPPRFPLVSPEVTVSPAIKHPWVNSQMVVDGSPLIKNFNVHSKLGRAMEQVIKQLHDQPPQPISATPLPYPPTHQGGAVPLTPPAVFTPPSVGGSFTPYTYSSAPQSTSSTGIPDSPISRGSRSASSLSAAGGGGASMKHYKCPPIPEQFEKVSQMDTDELKRFLADSESEGTVLVDEFVSKLDVITMVQRDREHLFQDNEDQAAINLGHEPELEDGWTQLQEKFLEMEALKDQHEKMLNEQRQLIERYQQRNVVSQLKTSFNNAETESEILADDFLDGKIPVTDFIQKYKQLRKLHHLRKTKYEKLAGH